MPCARSAASLARRSAIRWFSSMRRGGVVGHGVGHAVRCSSDRVAVAFGWSRLQSLLQDRLRRRCVWSPLPGPDFRLASTNSSRSPSSTFCVSLRSMPVRRSLMRRLVEHVVADLAAPADVGLGGFQRVASRRCASALPARTAWPPASSSRCRGWRAGCGRSGRRRRCWSGTWVMRTADSVLLTCWPPAPDER